MDITPELLIAALNGACTGQVEAYIVERGSMRNVGIDDEFDFVKLCERLNEIAGALGFVDGGASVTFENCTFENCTAPSSSKELRE